MEGKKIVAVLGSGEVTSSKTQASLLFHKWCMLVSTHFIVGIEIPCIARVFTKGNPANDVMMVWLSANGFPLFVRHL